MKEYHGWVIRNKRFPDYLDTYSFRPKRTDCIKEFTKNSRWSWRQFKARGWECVKVKLCPVEDEKQ